MLHFDDYDDDDENEAGNIKWKANNNTQERTKIITNTTSKHITLYYYDAI